MTATRSPSKIFYTARLLVIGLIIGVFGAGAVGGPGAAAAVNCIAAPGACGYPDAGNTGVPAGTALTPRTINGSMDITTPGAVVDALEISGSSPYIVVAANNVTIKRSRIHSDDYYPIRINGNVSGTVIQDVEIDCMSASEAGIVPNGAPYTAIRINVHSCQDGLRLSNNVLIQDSYIHDLNFNGAGPHYDGIQATDGSHVIIRHNTIFGRDNSSIFLKTDLGNIDDVLVENNLLNGGNYIFNMGAGTYPLPTNVRLTSNHFGRSWGYGPVALNGASVVVCGNVWDDNGQLTNFNNSTGCAAAPPASGSSGTPGSTAAPPASSSAKSTAPAAATGSSAAAKKTFAASPAASGQKTDARSVTTLSTAEASKQRTGSGAKKTGTAAQAPAAKADFSPLAVLLGLVGLTLLVVGVVFRSKIITFLRRRQHTPD